MTTYSQAMEIFNYIRNGYKGHLKSGNKQYDTSINDPDRMEIEGEYQPASLVKMHLRNQNQQIAERNVGVQRLHDVGSPAEYGGYLILNKLTSGNCYEMACIAAHLVKKKLHPAYIGIIDSPGDHAFCLASTVNPPATWTNVNEMSMAMDVEGVEQWIIDPWLGICCSVQDYSNKGQAKLRKWTQRGKRVLTRGQWVEPSNPVYVQGFLNGSLSFQSA
jgi:hypothetical protein